MKNIKVIVTVLSPLTERWAEYFCTEELSKVFDLEYWDCSKVAQPAFSATTIMDRSYAYTINDFVELNEKLKQLPPKTIMCTDVHLTETNYKFHKLVGKYVAACVYWDMWSYSLGMVPLTQQHVQYISTSKSAFDNVKAFFYKSDLLKLLVKFIRHRGNDQFRWDLHLYKEKQSIKKEEYVIHRCKSYYKKMFEFTTQPNHTFSINHPDYEKYIKLSKQPNERAERRYVVYIDQYLGHHPDSEESEPQKDHTACLPEFYESINRFFDKVEKQLNCHVIIAAHPVADYTINPFNDRQVMYFKTAELIFGSIGVCMHCSAAANFVALFDKPFALITTKGLNSSSFKKYFNQFANNLRSPIYDMDEIENVGEMFRKMDVSIRDSFLEKFINKANQKPNVELIRSYLYTIYGAI